MPTYRHGPKQYHHLDDIPAARRQLSHIFASYFGKEDITLAEVTELFAHKGFPKGEVAELTKMIEKIRGLVKKLDQKPAPAKQKAAENELLHLAGLLAQKSDKYKVRAAKRLKRAATHAQGGLPAQEASATGGGNDLERRIALIMDIAPKIWRRQIILDQEDSYVEGEFTEVLGQLDKIARHPYQKIALSFYVPKITASLSLAVQPYRKQVAVVLFHLFRAIHAEDERKTAKALELAIDRLGEVIARLRKPKT